MSLIERLLNLYRVDSQVRGLRKRLDSAQRYLDTQTKMQAQVNEQLDELQTRNRHLQATIGNAENEIAAIDEQLEKFRADLNTAVTNKQYSAVLTEMNTVKTRRGEIEDQMLKYMEQIEEHEKEIEDIQGQLAERTTVVEHAAAQLEQRKTDVGERLSELEEERKLAAADIPGRELAIFDHLADMYDGEVMSAIEEIDRRHHEYACGACNMRITFEQVNSALSGSDTLVTCTACDRILYMQDELKGALSPK